MEAQGAVTVKVIDEIAAPARPFAQIGVVGSRALAQERRRKLH
jgi:hypothetical protein